MYLQIGVRRSWRHVAYALLLPAIALGADGELDPGFGNAGVVPFGATQVYGSPAVSLQNDGRIIVCDAIRGSTTGYDFFIARYNDDGTPDTTFGSNGSSIVSFDANYVDDYCSAIAVQTDGKIVLVGARVHAGFPGDYAESVVTRIDAHGALDPTFGDGAGFVVPYGAGGAAAIVIDADGRIIVAGGAQPNALDDDFAVARLLPDGGFDLSFNGNGQLTIGFFPGSHSYDYATHVALDSEGRIVLAGNAGGQCGLIRLLPDGSFDREFGVMGMVTSYQSGSAQGFLIDHQGRLVVAGTIATTLGMDADADMSIARFLADGSIDTSFGADGVSAVRFDLASGGGGRDGATQVIEQSDGKLVAVGYAEYGDMGFEDAAAARVDQNGQIDPSFGTSGRNVFSFVPASHDEQRFTGGVLAGGRLVAVSLVIDGDTLTTLNDVLVRLQNDDILTGTFE